MKTKNLILIGGGGHCNSVIDVAENSGYTILGILDVTEKIGKKVLGYSIIGTDENISDYVSKALFIVTVGQIKDSLLRVRLHNKILSCGGNLATLVSNTAHVSKHSVILEGTVIMHQAVVNAGAQIGKGCIINTFANIEHDTIIGDYCHISTGAIVNGNCSVGTGTFIGSQAVIVNGISISDGCVIGAGTLVRRDIFQRGVYAGNPLKLIKNAM
jgi:sugar O-acyltransferase (sialic acid O-acetyltransferase NeuD family)